MHYADTGEAGTSEEKQYVLLIPRSIYTRVCVGLCLDYGIMTTPTLLCRETPRALSFQAMAMHMICLLLCGSEELLQ